MLPKIPPSIALILASIALTPYATPLRHANPLHTPAHGWCAPGPWGQPFTLASLHPSEPSPPLSLLLPPAGEFIGPLFPPYSYPLPVPPLRYTPDYAAHDPQHIFPPQPLDIPNNTDTEVCHPGIDHTNPTDSTQTSPQHHQVTLLPPPSDPHTEHAPYHTAPSQAATSAGPDWALEPVRRP